MSEQITQIILTIAPSVITILTMVGVIAKVISNFKSLKKDVVDMKCYDDQKAQMKLILEDNRALKKQINELLTKIDHIERK